MALLLTFVPLALSLRLSMAEGVAHNRRLYHLKGSSFLPEMQQSTVDALPLWRKWKNDPGRRSRLRRDGQKEGCPPLNCCRRPPRQKG